MKIRAAVLRERGLAAPYAVSHPLVTEVVDLDGPGPGEVRVRVESAGICHSDLSVVNGSRPRQTPMVLGHEAAGVIDAVGEGCSGIKLGDHVVLVFMPSCGHCAACLNAQPSYCQHGASANKEGALLRGGSRIRLAGDPIHHHLGVSAFAEYAVVDRSSVVVIDDDVPFDTAALFGCAVLTGTGAILNSAHLSAGMSCCVIGLGGVGLSALMTAVAIGAHPVVGVDPEPMKRAVALDIGADHVATPSELSALLADLGIEGFDCTVEAAGVVPALLQAIESTGLGGKTVAVGLPGNDVEVRVNVTSLVANSRHLTGSYMGASNPARDIPRIIRLWRAGRLPVERLHTSNTTISGINEAMDNLAAARAIRQIVHPHAPD